jgi:penicillin-binding protein 1B
MTNMMEGVLNFGTGYDVRRRGFTAPAAGKTGTSHDAWFAGYTSNLLCIVWVGYDDYSDLRLSGGQTAAPIWAEFMKKAVALPEYRDVKPFQQPAGVVDVQIDKITNRLATPACPQTITVAFIAGTEPKETCEQGPGDQRNLFQRIFGLGTPAAPPPQAMPRQVAPGSAVRRTTVAGQPQSSPPPPPAREKPKEKKGFFGKIVGIFKGDDADKPADKKPQ